MPLMRRTNRLYVRVDPQEKVRWQEQADSAGLVFSEWLRRVANGACGGVRTQPSSGGLCHRCRQEGIAMCAACKKAENSSNQATVEMTP